MTSLLLPLREKVPSRSGSIRHPLPQGERVQTFVAEPLVPNLISL